MGKSLMERIENSELDIAALKLLGQGRTASVHDYGDDKVVKLYQPEIPEDDADREWAASSLAFSLGIRTPKPYEIVRIEGRIGLVYQHISGVTLLDVIKGKPWAVSAGDAARTPAALKHRLYAGEYFPHDICLDQSGQAEA